MRWFSEATLTPLTKHLRLWHQVVREQSILEMMRNRVLIACGLFSLGFVVISIRLWDVMVWSASPTKRLASISLPIKTSRANIVDRNGEVIATHIPTASVYANPQVIIDAPQAAAKLSALFRDLDSKTILNKLTSKKGFIWIIRHISPKQQKAINEMGIPGIYLQPDEKRIYPHGTLFSHIIGYCGIENNGLAGVEKFFDDSLQQDHIQPLTLSLDLRAQYIVHHELSEAIQRHKAQGGNAILMDVETGEILAMVSLPDFDPNNPHKTKEDRLFNRNTLGRYEHGSLFKIFNVATALESGRITLKSRYDATAPIKVGRHKITDYAGKNCVLNVLQGFIYSSNIVSAKMALEYGAEIQKEFFKRYGLLDKPALELPEVVGTLAPREWKDVATMTLAYGYGIAVTPLQITNAIGAVINNGYYHKPTLIKKDPALAKTTNSAMTPILKASTSAQIRQLMRLAVTKGTVKKADVEGYDVIGKTGTAYKNSAGGYNKAAKQTSCITAFPGKAPKYVLFVNIDHPLPTAQTYGFATGGWVAAPTAGNIIKRIAPLYNIPPSPTPFDPTTNHLYSQLLPIQPVQYVSNAR